MMTLNIRVWCCVLVLLLVGAPEEPAADLHSEHDDETARTVEVQLDDFNIAMPDTLTAGPARLVIVNVGQAEHNVEFVGNQLAVSLGANLAPGERDTLAIEFKPGEYHVYCPVGRHEDYGMQMTLVVVDEEGRVPVSDTPGAPVREAMGSFQELIRWLGRFHPSTIHFPIALLIVAAMAELLFMRTGNTSFGFAARFCLWIGASAAVVAALFGWFFALEESEGAWLLSVHRWLGTATAGMALLALVLGERSYRSGDRRGRALYLALVFLAAAMVLVTGFFGGAMVFGLDHYAWP